jgi:UDP-GlcNAc:undecaprenyl-phosphate GlcNAc-1-phosphate transferase
MGDSGSQYLGFTVAVLVVYLVQVANPAASAALPLLLLGLPIADILMVLYKRATSGMNWFKATRNHVHHRLLDLGFSHFQSVVGIYALQALLVICAVLLRYADDVLIIAIYMTLIVSLFMGLSFAERAGWHLQRATAGIVDSPAWLPAVSLQRRLIWCIALTVPALCLFAALWVPEIPKDFGVTAGLVALAVALASLRSLPARALALRVGAYIAVAFAAWLFVRYPRDAAQLTVAATGIILALAVAVAVFVRFMPDRRFGTTPTDYLIVLAVLALALFWRFAGSGVVADGTLQFITYSIVLFYGCEVIISHFDRWQSVLGGSCITMLLIVAVRGLTGMI